MSSPIDNQLTIRAIALGQPLRLDGNLDEEVYQTEASISDFVQQVPKEGAPASYGISRVTTDRTRTPLVSNHPEGDVGLDAKYGVTANLTADVTVRTDFAQVEVDEQQVNLTRFSILYPEKRDFFLEGRGAYPF